MLKTVAISIAMSMALPAMASAQSTDPQNAQANRVEQAADTGAPVAAAPADYWKYTVGVGGLYISGKYGGTVDNQAFIAPLTLAASKNGLTLSATFSYIFAKGPLSAIPGEPVPPVVGQSVSRDGFGDIALRVKYRLPRRVIPGWKLDVLAGVKLPTASFDRSLGTGKVDYIAGIEVEKRGPGITPYLKTRYRISGDNAINNFRNNYQVEAGAGYDFSDKFHAELGYEIEQSRYRGAGAAHSITGAAVATLSPKLMLVGFGAVGLNQNASDIVIGSVLIVHLN